MLPPPEVIRETEGKERPLLIEPWVAAGFSRLWQAMKKHIENTIAAGTEAQPRNVQSAPASSHNRS
jgi:hypothetical protein